VREFRDKVLTQAICFVAEEGRRGAAQTIMPRLGQGLVSPHGSISLAAIRDRASAV